MNIEKKKVLILDVYFISLHCSYFMSWDTAMLDTHYESPAARVFLLLKYSNQIRREINQKISEPESN